MSQEMNSEELCSDKIYQSINSVIISYQIFFNHKHEEIIFVICYLE